MNFVGLFFNKSDDSPLYYQLYSYLAEEIRSGRLPAEERLPSKRSAAAELGLSVNTVDTAYQMLAAEGYINAKPRSGFVVSQLEKQQIPPPAASQPRENAVTSPATPWQYSFSSGGLDMDFFPLKTWNRILREVLSSRYDLFAQGEPMGDLVLRQAIAEYLQGFRGARCQEWQIVVGAGLEVLTGMLVRLFEGKLVATENPGYRKNARVLHNMGRCSVAVGVDEFGMQPELLEASGAQVAYLTPSHQFPTGGIMPVGRRSSLLSWASAPENYIIEDDYDSEFRFDGRPIPCLQGLDKSGRHVIYAGTFSRSLAPGLRAAYLVLPPRLLESWKQAYGDYACTISRPEQHTLANFMSGGHFARHLNRIRNFYRQRRDLLIAAIEKHFPSGTYKIENQHTGLYFILWLPGQNAKEISLRAAAASLRVHALSEYFSQPNSVFPNNENEKLILGYGGLPDKDIDAAVLLLRQSVLADASKG